MFNTYQTNTLSYNRAACIRWKLCEIVYPQVVFIVRDRLAELVHPKACMGSVPARRIVQLMRLLLKVAWDCAVVMIRAALTGQKEASYGSIQCTPDPNLNM